MKTIDRPQYVRLIRVRYHGPTESRGSRVSISADFPLLGEKKRIYEGYDYETSGSLDQGLAMIRELHNFDIVSFSEDANSYIVAVKRMEIQQ